MLLEFETSWGDYILNVRNRTQLGFGTRREYAVLREAQMYRDKFGRWFCKEIDDEFMKWDLQKSLQNCLTTRFSFLTFVNINVDNY